MLIFVKQVLDRLGTHLRDELVRIIARQFAKTLVRQQVLLLEIRHVAFVDDDVGLEVKDLFEIAKRDVEQVADTRRQSLKEPDVRARAGQLDMAEPLAAHLRLRDFDAALVADHAAVLHPLVFSAETFPIRDRAEDAGTEQPVTFRLECAVVDRFRLGHLAVRPRTDLFRRREAECGSLRNLWSIAFCCRY